MDKSSISIISQRYGPNQEQLKVLAGLVKDEYLNCKFYIGGDKGERGVYNILKSLKITVAIIPASDGTGTYYDNSEVVGQPLSLKVRNAVLVDNGEMIIGLPQTMNELEDSPCWKTIRSASTKDKEVIVISPNGFIWGLE